MAQNWHLGTSSRRRVRSTVWASIGRHWWGACCRANVILHLMCCMRWWAMVMGGEMVMWVVNGVTVEKHSLLTILHGGGSKWWAKEWILCPRWWWAKHVHRGGRWDGWRWWWQWHRWPIRWTRIVSQHCSLIGDSSTTVVWIVNPIPRIRSSVGASVGALANIPSVYSLPRA